MRGMMRSVLVLAVFAGSVWSIGATDESLADAVEFYFIPTYSGMYPGTEIVFQVVVDVDGTVVSVETVSVDPPAPALPAIAADAVRRWKFKHAEAPILRDFELRVRFEGAWLTESPGTSATLEPPMSFRVYSNAADVARIDRVDGVVPTKSCSLHGVPMDVTRVPNRYRWTEFGYREYSDKDRWRMTRFGKAEDRRFPNAPIGALVKCDPPSNQGGKPSCKEYAEVYYCPLCVEARTIWCTKHPKTCLENNR